MHTIYVLFIHSIYVYAYIYIGVYMYIYIHTHVVSWFTSTPLFQTQT